MITIQFIGKELVLSWFSYSPWFFIDFFSIFFSYCNFIFPFWFFSTARNIIILIVRKTTKEYILCFTSGAYRHFLIVWKCWTYIMKFMSIYTDSTPIIIYFFQTNWAFCYFNLLSHYFHFFWCIICSEWVISLNVSFIHGCPKIVKVLIIFIVTQPSMLNIPWWRFIHYIYIYIYILIKS